MVCETLKACCNEFNRGNWLYGRPPCNRNGLEVTLHDAGSLSRLCRNRERGQVMITVNELFSGIGAQVAALRRIGVSYQVVGIGEIDKYAIKSYEAINGETRNYGDISKIERLDYADLWTYSFPCQDLSIAGKQLGLNGTRSGLLREVERLLKLAVAENSSPKYLLLENVKNLVGKKFKPDFDKWLSTLDDLGYNNYWKVLNAKDYGVPQNRERVFVVSIRKDIDTHGYTFPEPFKLTRRLKDVLETNVDECYYLREELVEKFVERLKAREVSNTVRCGGLGSTDIKHTWDLVAEPTIKLVGNVYYPDKNYGTGYAGATYDTSGISATLTTMGGGNREPLIIQNPRGYNNGGVKELASTETSGGGNYTQNNFAQALTAHLHKESVNDCTKIDRHSPATGVIQLGFGIGHNPISKKFEFDGFHADKVCPTILATDYKCPKCWSNGVRIRKLTEKECWRLMDFTDEEFEAAQKAGVSKTQLYKQAGNSIVVGVLAKIFEKLFQKERGNDEI